MRTLLLRWLGVSLVLWVLVVVITGAATWALVLGGAAPLMLAADVIWLNYRVRRDEREGRPGDPPSTTAAAGCSPSGGARHV